MAVIRYGMTALMVMCLGASVGCDQYGPDTAPVKGVVTLDGEPVFGKVVSFSPISGQSSSSGYTNKQGEYELSLTGNTKGAYIGKHTVGITTQNPNDFGPPPPSWVETIPAKYNAESDLTREVKKGKNTIDFELTSD